MGKEFNLNLIEVLDAGVQYVVRVAAVNEAGRGQSAHSSPPSLPQVLILGLKIRKKSDSY